MAIELFGFQIQRKNEENKNVKSFVAPTEEDGAVSLTATGGAISSFIDLEGTARSEADLISRYRSMMQQPEVQAAIDDIVNESINIVPDEKVITCVTDDLKMSESIKTKIRDEFDEILKLLDFGNVGYDIFTKWYVDGRLNYHVLIDETAPKKGIQELRYVDPRKIRKVREFKKEKVGTNNNPGFVKKVKNEYYIYNEKGFNNKYSPNQAASYEGPTATGLKIANDSIVNCNSGLLNEKNTLVLSHLHKAYKPLNQLRMMEDAVVIYRISRAPERRVFYIDVGNLPKMKAEQYLRDMMTKHKNRVVYDANTGEIRDDRKHMSMTDDFWLPRREGGRGTEITSLPGGANLGEMEDVIYFQKRLFRALNVPVSRLESDTGFSLGRASEISRDEVKFNKFIRRLRARFSMLFDKILVKQLILKGIIAPEDWLDIQTSIRYDYMQDSHFQELKEAEVIQNRLQLLRDIDDFTGKYFSTKWVRSNILQMSEDDMAIMDKEIAQETPEDEDEQQQDSGGFQ